MSELTEHALSLEQAWNNLTQLELGKNFVGNIALVGYGKDTTTYQQACILLARPEAPVDSFERNRRLEGGTSKKGDKLYVATTPLPTSEDVFRPYATMLTYTDKGTQRDLHVVSTGRRATPIAMSLVARAGRKFSDEFGRGEPSNYDADSADPNRTPVVSALLNIGWRNVKNDADLIERVERSATYGIVTHPRYAEATEFPFLNHILPGTARAAHSLDAHETEPKPFMGQPYLLPTFDSPLDTLNYYWEEVLPEDQKVAMAVLSVRGLQREYFIQNAGETAMHLIQ